MTEADWPQVKEIFQQGIDTGNATFAQDPPRTWKDWSHSKDPAFSFVAAAEDQLFGWVALSPTSSKAYYRGVMEVSLYVASLAQGQGVGQALLQHIITYSEAHDVWALNALIFPENTASLHMHQKFGFKLMCVRERLGLMTFGPYQGKWRDVAFLERRSLVAGK
jgi:phosphinothricin acetyltransferase